MPGRRMIGFTTRDHSEGDRDRLSRTGVPPIPGAAFSTNSRIGAFVDALQEGDSR
jgi:hypothetical protein